MLTMKEESKKAARLAGKVWMVVPLLDKIKRKLSQITKRSSSTDARTLIASSTLHLWPYPRPYHTCSLTANPSQVKN